MEHWQSGQAENRPAWLNACEEPTQALLESSDLQERTAALALWLMLGHTDRTSEFVAALNQSQETEGANALVFDAAQLASWLPSDERLVLCRKLVAANGEDIQQIIATLEQITVVDDPQLAEWIYERLVQESIPNTEPHQLAMSLIRALVGFSAGALPSSNSPQDFEYSAQAPYAVARSKTLVAVPGRIQACEWLRKRYRTGASDRQRAVALAALARLDRKTAVDASLGAIAEAEAEGELLQTALAIALNDAAAPSAERAMLLLDHQLPAVRVAALQTLTIPRSAIKAKSEPLLPVIVEYPGVLPGFWLSKQKPPIEILHGLVVAESDPAQQSRAILLLLAAGEHANLAALESQLAASHAELAKLTIAAAIAKAGRTDEEAVKYYEQVYAESSTPAGGGDDRIAAALYEILRDLDGQPILELRRRMRNEKGSRLFNNNVSGESFEVP
jgi:hypothetical protein